MTAKVFDMVKMVMRAYKYRFYPTPEQAAESCRTLGCVRKVWNLALAARTTAWHQRHERLTYLQSSALLTQWKRSEDLAFLAEVSSVPLQQVSRDAAGRWFVSLLCRCPVETLPASAAVVGVDAGITSLVTLSTGEKVANPRHERRDRVRLARAQRRLARTRPGSATGTRPGARWRGSMPGSPTGAGISCISLRRGSSAITKRS